MGLEPFEAYASLLQDNQVQPYVSLRLPPPGEPTRKPAELRAESRRRFGQPRTATDEALQSLVAPAAQEEAPLGRRPRRGS